MSTRLFYIVYDKDKGHPEIIFGCNLIDVIVSKMNHVDGVRPTGDTGYLFVFVLLLSTQSFNSRILRIYWAADVCTNSVDMWVLGTV